MYYRIKNQYYLESNSALLWAYASPHGYPWKLKIIHSENIYYVPGKVLGAGATKKKDVVPVL